MINETLKELAEQCSSRGPSTWRTVATNLTDLHRGPSFLDELLTQVVNGTRLEILKEQDRWSFVRQEDGYLGWAYSGYLTDSPAPQATHVVLLPAAGVSTERADLRYGTMLLGGTKVCVTAKHEKAAQLELCGAMLPQGRIPISRLRDLSSFPLTAEQARGQMVEDARKMTGVYYLWGGNTAFGTDCSGLAQLVHRLCGYEIPRDADMQFAVSRPVEALYRAGDLLFFHSDSNPSKITHVGISTGGWNMIHSSRKRNGVYEEDVQSVENLRATFAGGRTFLK